MLQEAEDTVETEITAPVVDNINDDIASAIEELADPKRREDGKFKASSDEDGVSALAENPDTQPEGRTTPVVVEPAPQGWGESVKAEWPKLPQPVRSEILRREGDFHRALTSPSGELNFGRQIKEVVTPYMATIQAEGGNAVTAVASLLNTAHVLRTGTPEQKKALIFNTAKQFNVDLGVTQEDGEYIDPRIAALEQKISELQKQTDPATIESRLREQADNVKIQSDIAAFASDPAHTHFETVRPLMKALFDSGQAGDLKEAYDMACMANPAIRSTIEAAKAAEAQTKRKQEIDAKKRAASSITGSPAIPSNSKVTNSKSSVEDDLRAAFDELEQTI